MSTAPDTLPPSPVPDDEALPPRTGGQRLLWLVIWVIGAASAVGLVTMVYVLAREMMAL